MEIEKVKDKDDDDQLLMKQDSQPIPCFGSQMRSPSQHFSQLCQNSDISLHYQHDIQRMKLFIDIILMLSLHENEERNLMLGKLLKLDDEISQKVTDQD